MKLTHEDRKKFTSGAKFTDAEVRNIRSVARAGEVSARDQARLYGCGVETMRRIIRGETYWWVADEEEELLGRAEGSGQGLERLQGEAEKSPEGMLRELEEQESLKRLAELGIEVPGEGK